MRIRELRIRHFMGIKRADIQVKENGTFLIEPPESSSSNSNESAAMAVISQALRWVVYGDRTGKPRDDSLAFLDPCFSSNVLAAGECCTPALSNDALSSLSAENCSVQLDLDAFSIHRTISGNPPAESLRFFMYDPNPFCCAITVKELTKGTVRETQRLIEEKLNL